MEMAVNEYEIFDLLSNDSAQMAAQFSIYLTIMSGYLLVAYFEPDWGTAELVVRDKTAYPV